MKHLLMSFTCVLSFVVCSAQVCDIENAQFTIDTQMDVFDPSPYQQGEAIANIGSISLSFQNEILEVSNVVFQSNCNGSNISQNGSDFLITAIGFIDSTASGGVDWLCDTLFITASFDYLDIFGGAGAVSYSNLFVLPTDNQATNYYCENITGAENLIFAGERIILNGQSGKGIFRTGNEGEGKVWTSNENGVADWQTSFISGSILANTGNVGMSFTPVYHNGVTAYVSEHDVVFPSSLTLPPNIVIASMQGNVGDQSSIVNVYVKKGSVTNQGFTICVVDLTGNFGVILSWIAK